ncbi:MAG: papain-like cysteine peptidase [Clostridium sp.]|jgi:hypothetical protein|nr:papain-like cysteine peptidase [Clostridium sp.]
MKMETPRNADEMVFEETISLGCNCHVAWHLRCNLLRMASMPFDWLVTPYVAKVHSLIENKFIGFMDRDNMKRDAQSGKMFDIESEVQFFHDFLPCDLEIQYEYVFEKYRRRTSRFMAALESKKCLFIRQQSKTDSFQECVALGEYLRGFNKENCLYIITNDECEKLQIKQIFDGIFCVSMSHKSCALLSHPFGNDMHWLELLRNIYHPSNHMIKKLFENTMENLTDTAVQSGREVVFWGCGNIACYILRYFLCRGIVPKFYDRNKAIILNAKYERISKDKFLPHPDRYFVVVTPLAMPDRDVIAEELKSNGFERHTDYCAVPRINHLYNPWT